jgi:hypothetical protein
MYLPKGDVVSKTVNSILPIILVDNDLGNVILGSSIAVFNGASNHADNFRQLATGN